MKTISSAALVALIAASLATVAQESVKMVQITIQATITSSPFTTLGYRTGDVIHGWYEYDPAMPPEPMDPEVSSIVVGTVYYPLPPLHLAFGQTDVQTRFPIGLRLYERHWVAPVYPSYDEYHLQCWLDGPPVEGFTPHLFQLSLQDMDYTVFADVSLPFPIAPPPLEPFDVRQLRIGFSAEPDEAISRNIYAHVDRLEPGPDEDVTPPVMVCPPDLSLDTVNQVPPPTFTGSVTDNLDPSPIVIHSFDWIEGFNPIVITRSFNARDASGNTASCTQTFTIHPRPGDLNGDGCIDREDLDIVMGLVRSRLFDPACDLNRDGKVDAADARFLTLHFTKPGGAPCGAP